MISKSLSTSEKYARLTTEAGDLAEFCQALYPLLVAHSDDYGRLAGDTYTVKALVVPGSPRTLDDVHRAIQALHNVGLVVWYEAQGRKVIQITNFDEHQVGLHKRTKSRLPGIPGNFPEIPSEQKGTEQKRTEPKLNEGGEASSPPPPAADAALVFSTVGVNGNTWSPTTEQLAFWRTAYPALDIEAECRRAQVWLESHPERRKTAGGMARFLVGWFNRSNDKGGGHLKVVAGTGTHGRGRTGVTPGEFDGFEERD